MNDARLRRTILAVAAVAIAASLSFVTSPGQATVGRVSLESLANSADIIVVAQVERVSPPLLGNWLPSHPLVPQWLGGRIATARVLDAWKGQVPTRVRFRASPTWTCDTSYAIKGEQVLLLLTHPSWRSVRDIVHSGRGRMPVTRIDGQEYAHISTGGVAWVRATHPQYYDGEYVDRGWPINASPALPAHGNRRYRRAVRLGEVRAQMWGPSPGPAAAAAAATSPTVRAASAPTG